MKLRRRMVLKVLFACGLVLLSAFSSFLIKDFLSLGNPENALPKITVAVNERLVYSESIVLSAYSWRFMLVAHVAEPAPFEVWHNLPPTPVSANHSLDISFSYPQKLLELSRADGEAASSFIAISAAEGCTLYTPSEPGIYTYKVQANWGWLGSVLYYFKIEVH